MPSRRNSGPPQEVERSDAMFYSYGVEGPDPAISAACLSEIEPVHRSSASFDVRGRIAGTRSTVKDGLTFGDYQFFRPAEAIPKRIKEAIAACDEAYQRIGLLRNIIDLMSDFASQGIEVFHPSKTKQARYRAWFRKIGGKERSERFLNLLYRHGNVVVKRAFADLNLGDLEDLERGVAGRAPDRPEDVPYRRGMRVYKNRIPLQYTFLNPTAVDVVGGDLALFAGEPRYSLRLPEQLIKTIKSPKSDDDRRLISLLPDWVTGPVRQGKKNIPLDPERITVAHYKKDDWQQWAFPMTYSILSDLKLYEKNKLADMAALDGAVSHIRLWRLGLPEYKIQPGPAAFARLREQLLMAVGGGSMDLIWDASLDLKETSTDIYNFLGIKKYEPVLKAIYAGLGIPQTLTGGSEGQGGMTNNAMSLKTLIERLQYGRDCLTKFWENELAIMQEALGDRYPAQVHFENMSISDEANEKMLWMHLVDRDIVSVETMREKFGTIPAVEDARIRREYDARKQREIPAKSSPYHDAQPDLAKQKIALQTGVVSPQQVDTPLEPGKGGDKLIDVQKQQLDLQEKQGDRQHQLDKKQLDVQVKQGDELHQQKIQQNDEVHQQRLQHRDQEHKAMLPVKKQALKRKLAQQARKGTPGAGRPRNAKDAQKRKPRVVTPRTAASMMQVQSWARGAQSAIAEVVTAEYLSRCKKKSLRHLTNVQADELEDIKFRILFATEPRSEVDREAVLAMIDDLPPANEAAEGLMMEWLSGSAAKPTLEEIRDMQVTAYAIINIEGEDDDGEAHGDA